MKDRSLLYRNERDRIVRKQAGLIVVEYVLLLSVAVTIAMIIVSQLVKRDADDPENSGALIKKWRQIQETIAKDTQN